VGSRIQDSAGAGRSVLPWSAAGIRIENGEQSTHSQCQTRNPRAGILNPVLRRNHAALFFCAHDGLPDEASLARVNAELDEWEGSESPALCLQLDRRADADRSRAARPAHPRKVLPSPARQLRVDHAHRSGVTRDGGVSDKSGWEGRSQQFRDPRWGRQRPVPSPWTQPKRHSALGPL
jgi:hypothetical protein